MKKIISGVLILSFFSVYFTACLKDKGFEDHKYGITDPAAQPPGVGFPEAGNAANFKSLNVSTDPQTIEFPGLNLLSGAKAPQDIHVNITVDPSIIDDYNAANPGSSPIVELPADAYTLPSLKITIPKGEQGVIIPITFPNSSTLDASQRFGLGLSITSVDEGGYLIAGNLKKVLAVFSIKNEYEGYYKVDIVLVHPSAGGTYHDDAVYFSTISSNTVQAYLAVLQVFAASSKLNIEVNPDNSLTLSSNATTIDPTDPALNYYDPATRTFHFDYGYSSGSRRITGTAVRNP